MEIEKENPNFKSCEDCIYSDDNEEICFLRRCIHAVSRLKECYIPKQAIKLSASTIYGYQLNVDCISREAAIDTVCKASCDSGFCGVECDEVLALRNMPPAQQERTGKWIRNDNGTWSCDQCNSWIPDEQHHYARFCLYCGAKMKGD